jgi:hypothetical protein
MLRAKLSKQKMEYMHSIATLYPTGDVLSRFQDLTTPVQIEIVRLLEKMARNECNSMKHLLRSVGFASSSCVCRPVMDDEIAEDEETDAAWERDADELSAILRRFYDET